MNEEMTSIRFGTGKELPLQASKWLDLQLLIDADEMKSLFSSLGEFKIFRVGAVCSSNEGEILKSTFLEKYAHYIECLKQGIIPEEKEYRPYFSSIFTLADDHVFQIAVGNDRRILRVEKPVLQLQVNQIAYSPVDGKFRGMVFGKESVLWGIHFSYPQLFQDAVTKEVFSVVNGPQFPNTALYRELQLWTRQNTLPTPFQVGEQRVNVPIRLGKNCFTWINSHPQLANSDIRVVH
jgi:hypothetical protein